MPKATDKLLYNKEHEWVLQLGENRVRIGISDYAQKQLGDIVFVETSQLGATITANETIETMDDLRANHVDIITISQYLQPPKQLLNVQKYYSSNEFEELKTIALSKGFSHCESGPLVRSSYHADEQVQAAKVNT